MIPTKSIDYLNLNLEALRGKTTSKDDEITSNDTIPTEKATEPISEPVENSEDILNTAFNAEEDHTAIWDHIPNSLDWNVNDV